jgi:hypothetical protein
MLAYFQAANTTFGYLVPGFFGNNGWRIFVAGLDGSSHRSAKSFVHSFLNRAHRQFFNNRLVPHCCRL